MTDQTDDNTFLEPLLAAHFDIVLRSTPNLTAFQLAIFLLCYSREAYHTVRGLASQLQVARSTISKVLARLTDLDLVGCAPDPRDRRNVLVRHTLAGAALLADLRRIVAVGAKQTTRSK